MDSCSCFCQQSKYDILVEGQTKAVIQERKLMEEVRHPFIVDMIVTFQCQRFIYLVTELLQGGELFSLIDEEGMPEEEVKFYTLCVADALAYLHTMGIVYRGEQSEHIEYEFFVWV